MEGSEAVETFSVEEASVVADGGAAEVSAANVSDFHRDDLSKDVSWLEDSDDKADGASMLDREWKTRHEQFYNAGYREGISAGRNDAAQEGFNHGFKDSVMIGYKWGIVRGVTSALAHLPNELKVKLVEKDEVRKQFLSLHGVVDSISTGDALRFFYEDIQRAKPAEQRSTVEDGSSATHQSSSERGALENYIGKLELLLEQCPAVDLHSELNQDRVP